MSLPHFRFYAKDWLVSTSFMSDADKGAYITALCLSWEHDGLPSDIELPPKVASKFKLSEDGKLRNRRLEEARAEAMQAHAQKVEAGRLGGRPKKQSESCAKAEVSYRLSCAKADGLAEPKLSLSGAKATINHKPYSSIEENNTPLPPQGATAAKPLKAVTYSDDFEAFWSVYPRKIGKGEAWSAWQKRRAPLPDIAEVLPVLRRAMNSPQWIRDGGQFVPHPTTWINQRRWEDGGDSSGDGDTAEKAGGYL